MVADTTAQEAAIPYPNEIGLLSWFLTTVVAASKTAGQALKDFVKTAAPKISATAHVVTLIEGVQKQLGEALKSAESGKQRLGKYARLATAKAEHLSGQRNFRPQFPDKL